MDKKPIQEEPEHITKEVATEVVEANRVERGQGESEDSFLTKKSVAFIAGILILFGLYLSSLYNYLLFHSLAEIFSIVVAWAIFILAWNSRRIMDNNYLLFIGIAYLFIGDLDLVHTLGYSGMGIFHGYATNLPTQLWIASRYMESLSLLIAPLFLTRRLRADLVLMIYALVTALVLGSVFYWHISPTCFVEGVGLTPFKKISEYIISIILIGAITVLFQKRKEFDERVFRLLVASIAFTIASELAFTFYISAYGFSNLVGHYFKIISFYLIYKAIIETGLTRPYTLLFRNLKQREEALRESEEKYRSMMEAMKDPVYICSSDYRVEYMNPTMIRRTGRDAIGEHCFKVLHGLDEKCSWCMHAKAQQGEYLESEIVSPQDNRSYHVSQSSIVHEDGSISKMTVFRDTTDLKKLETQLQQAQKMEAIGTLAGGVAHDLNNILGGLVSYPELLLLQLPEDSPLRKSILTIQKSGEKAAAVVQDLLTLARRGVVVTEVVNPNDVIAEYLKSPEHENLQSYHHGVHIETHLEKDSLNILGSSTHLSKTVMNLVSNAAEAMPQGGKLTISTENRYIDRPIRGYEDVVEGDYVVLAISDTGAGIAPDDIGKIFEPFYTKKKMGRSGTGLGMAVVWGTVKDHNGYIDVQSTEGTGTTFTLYFPVTRKELPEDKSHLAIGSYSGHGESILIVDDVEQQRNIASGMLKELGYSVVSVPSGEEALEYLKTNKVDLLVLDMIMDPGMDGLDTYKKILEIYPGQKAIIASGFSETDRVKEVQSLGAGAYIRKPLLLEKVGLAVKEELEK